MERGGLLGTKRLPSCMTGDAPELFEQQKRPATEGDCVRTGATRETDNAKIQSRLKQIQFGKNTTGYDNYIAAVPKRKRTLTIDKHPRTPDPYEIQSKRQFDGKIRVWRRGLHLWDNHGDAAFSSSSTSSSVPLGSLDAIVNQSKKRLELTSKPPPPPPPYIARREMDTETAANIQQCDGYGGEGLVGVAIGLSNMSNGGQIMMGQGANALHQNVRGNGVENDITTHHMDVTTTSTTVPDTCDIFCDGEAGSKEIYSSVNVLGDTVEVLRAVGGIDDENDNDDDDDDVL